MNILFYTVASKRTRDIESLALEFTKRGHQVFLLTQSQPSELHEFFASQQFFNESYVVENASLIKFTIKQARALIRFCSKHRIDVVYSHLDICNLVSVVAQYFSKARFIICRHHAEAIKLEANRRGMMMSKAIYSLAKTIIVVSRNSKKFMTEVENISSEKIHVIPVTFDFSLYEIPSREEVVKIRDQYPASLLLITIGRLIPLKRIDLIIELTKKLISKGLDVKLMILGSGPEEKRLKLMVDSHSLNDQIIFLGFNQSVLSYLSAADLYIHFSESEASCTTVKEAGIVSKPAIVCRHVGDFDEYASDGVTGWCVDKTNCLDDTYKILIENSADKNLLSEMGRNLHDLVVRKFDIKNVIEQYEQFHKR